MKLIAMIGLHNHQQGRRQQQQQQLHLLDQLNNQQQAANMIGCTGNNKPRSSKQLERPQLNIVRVAAKTAMPIVSSVPKCRNPKASSRLHPLDTVNGICATRSLMSEQIEPISGTGTSNLLLQQQQQLDRGQHHHSHKYKIALDLQAKAQANDDDRVILIVNDDHITGGGVPIIGRRVPSKSAARMQSSSSGGRASGKRVIDYSQPASIQLTDSIQVIPLNKVIGRRSHRLQQQQHPSQLEPNIYQDQRGGSKRQSSNYSHRHQSMSTLYNASADENADYSMPQMRQIFAHKDSELDLPVAGSYNLVSSEVVARPPTQHNRKSMIKKERILASSSCTSLCCAPELPQQQQQRFQPAECRESCCREDYCDECGVDEMPPCCKDIGQSHRPTISADRLSRSSSSRPSTHYHNNNHINHQHRHHHNDCQANNGSTQAGAMLRSQASLSAAQSRTTSHRSSSCKERQRYNSKPNHHHHQANNRLPVPAKPQHLSVAAAMSDYIQSGSKLSSAHSIQDHQQQDACAAVSQMYESLAAELKAKLGNPRTAPILLPPKDYDTLSRRQGKLTGIELRRSTNPQLVGPVMNSSTQNTCHQSNINSTMAENKEAPQLASRSDESLIVSARSSGRGSQDERSSSTSCRSRSNSSSGLGSISLGAQSPNSSTGSPSDEIQRQKSNNLSSAKGIKLNVDEVRVHLESPDGLHSGASDSGHSGSGDQSQHNFNNLSSPSSSSISSTSPTNANDGANSSARDNTNHSLSVQSPARGKGIQNHHPSKVSNGVLWNGRVEIPLKVNSEKNGNTYLATKQIIY